jgi:hypothetical protein
MLATLTPSQIGDISEAIVRARFIEKGYVVLIPQNSALRYDIVVEKDGIFQRVQIKTGRLLDGETVYFSASSKDAVTKADVHYHGCIELFAIYCPQNEQVYVMPVQDATSTTCTLRLTPAKNNQRNGIRWAADYQF